MRTFNCKIILFGEYAVLSGAKLLAIPFNKFKGNLSIPSSYDELRSCAKKSNQILKPFVEFLSAQVNFQIQPDIMQMQKDVNAGLFFHSNIPQRYGLGSSGALVAAMYNRYFYDSINFKNNSPISKEKLQLDFSQMESYFHGKSSGADPLISYLNSPVVINGNIDSYLFPKDITAFLIDSKVPSKTEGLVKLYLEKRKNKKFNRKNANFIDKTNQCVDNFLNKDKNLFSVIKQLESAERELLPEMFIEPNVLQNSEDDIKKNTAIKLCGSGGGGFLLGFTPSAFFSKTKDYFEHLNIPIITLSNSQSI